MADWNTDLITRYDRPGPRYTSYPPVTRFHEEVTPQDYWTALHQGNQARRPLSLYLHIPFCRSGCYYCACNRIITADKAAAAAYLPLLLKEIRLKAEQIDSQRPVLQMYWGGGTPTFLDDAQITELIYSLARHFSMLDDDRGDYAIEIDPRTVDHARLGLLRGLGFNRVSLGIQDLDPRVQLAVNRVQPLAQIKAVFDACRDFGFRTINTDLIYGLPWQSTSTLARTIEQLVRLRPDRISLYSYAHQPARFKVQRQISEQALPSPAEKLAMFTGAAKLLEQAGYRLTGMEHFALDSDSLSLPQDQGQLLGNFQGDSARSGADLLGFGVSAISQLGQFYGQNQHQLGPWQAALENGELPLQAGYMLNRDEQIRRAVIQALLSEMELDMSAISTQWQIVFTDYFSNELQQLGSFAADGLLHLEQDRIHLTETGRRLVRAVAMVFDHHQRRHQQVLFSRII